MDIWTYIMDIYYIKKMNELLRDDVYQKQEKGYAKIEREKFNKHARKILKKSKMGKQLLFTLEQDPTPQGCGVFLNCTNRESQCIQLHQVLALRLTD